MVRPRMKLKKVEDEHEREKSFAHNTSIMTKKVEELSILTAVDVMLLAFSPSGNPTICLGQNCNLNEVVTKFWNRTRQEREIRRLENLQTIKTECGKKGHNIDIDAIHKAWMEKRVKDLNEELNELKTQLDDLNHKRSLWDNPKNITNMKQMIEMEVSLTKSIYGLQKRKRHLNCEEAYNLHSSHCSDVDRYTCPSTSTGITRLGEQSTFQQPNYDLSGFDEGFELGQEDEFMQQLGSIDPSYLAGLFEPQQNPSLTNDTQMD